MSESASVLSGYAENYSQTGDIIVVAMCILFVILIRSSFVNRTNSFRIFCVMLVTIAVAAYSSIILHMLLSVDPPPHTVITALRILHHAALFANLFLFSAYFIETMHIEARKRRYYLTVGSIALAALILYMSVGAVFDLGAFRSVRTDGQAWVQVFNAGYLFFVSFVAYLSIRYRGRIYRQVAVGVLASSGIAFLLLIIQSYHRQSSYTAASFLFPAVSLLYLVHANPYDLELGAVNVSGFEDYIQYYRRHGRELLLMSLLLPDFDDNEHKYPDEVRRMSRYFASHYFRGAVLFQVSNGRMILTMETRRNPNYEEIIHQTIDRFNEMHKLFQLDHKVVITTTLSPQDDRDNFNYIDLIQFVESRMPVNTIRRIPQDDIENYHRYHDIITQLGDINASQNMYDPRVQVFCQPVLNLQTNRYDTAEALMRLKLDGIGMVSPGDFIPLAEEYGYITTLSKIILTKTCAQIRRLTDAGYYVRRISVNFSMLDLRDPHFSEEISQIIRNSGIPSEKIAIELTESQNERDFMLVKERISELHNSGIKFYLDDFGTGYSNFDRIMQLPFDIIKFDRSLVVASGTDAEKKTMVSHLARMFRDTHYSVLYEGIETDSDQTRCTDMCAEYLQGYKFSKPIPIEQLQEFFERDVQSAS